MPTLSELAEDIQRRQDKCVNLEHRERELSGLESSGKWEGLYDEPSFRRICDANQKELKAERVALTRAEAAFSSAVFATAKTAQEGRQLASSAMTLARANLNARNAEMLKGSPEDPSARALEQREKDARERYGASDLQDWTRSKDYSEISGR